MKHKNLLLLLLALPMMAVAQTVKSPNGNVVLTFSLTDNGRPTYEMTYKGKAVVKPSHLGLELAKDKHASMGMEESDLMEGFSIVDTRESSFDETWQPVWGETRDIRNRYNELAVTLDNKYEYSKVTAKGENERGRAFFERHRTVIIRFRVYDDGIGLRYEFPQQKELNYFLIKEEHTEFAMAGDHKAWWLPGDYDTQEQMTQETKLSEIRGKMQEAVNWGNSSVAVFSPTGCADLAADEERRRTVYQHPRGCLCRLCHDASRTGGCADQGTLYPTWWWQQCLYAQSEAVALSTARTVHLREPSHSRCHGTEGRDADALRNSMAHGDGER